MNLKKQKVNEKSRVKNEILISGDYTKIPFNFLKKDFATRNDTAKLLLMLTLRLHKYYKDSFRTFDGYAAIAQEFGISKRNIKKCLQELIDDNLIFVRKFSRRVKIDLLFDRPNAGYVKFPNHLYNDIKILKGNELRMLMLLLNTASYYNSMTFNYAISYQSDKIGIFAKNTTKKLIANIARKTGLLIYHRGIQGQRDKSLIDMTAALTKTDHLKTPINKGDAGQKMTKTDHYNRNYNNNNNNIIKSEQSVAIVQEKNDLKFMNEEFDLVLNEIESDIKLDKKTQDIDIDKVKKDKEDESMGQKINTGFNSIMELVNKFKAKSRLDENISDKRDRSTSKNKRSSSKRTRTLADIFNDKEL